MVWSITHGDVSKDNNMMLLGEGQGSGRKTLFATLAATSMFFLDIVLIKEISFLLPGSLEQKASYGSKIHKTLKGYSLILDIVLQRDEVAQQPLESSITSSVIIIIIILLIKTI